MAGGIFRAARGRYNDLIGVALPSADYSEKEGGTSTTACPSNTLSFLNNASQLYIPDCGKWWVCCFVQFSISMGATPPTDIAVQADFAVDFDQGNGAGGTSTDVHHVPRQLLVANAVVPFSQLLQLFGVCSNPPNVVVPRLKLNPAGQAVTVGGYINFSAWSGLAVA